MGRVSRIVQVGPTHHPKCDLAPTGEAVTTETEGVLQPCATAGHGQQQLDQAGTASPPEHRGGVQPYDSLVTTQLC